MTIKEVQEEFGSDVDTLCKNLCAYCTANDWYCPDDCRAIEWIRKHPDKAFERLAKYDGDCVKLLQNARNWK